MTLTIELEPEIENDLRHAAADAGLSPVALAAKLLRQGLKDVSAPGAAGKHLSRVEANLLQRINSSLSQIEWQQYHALIAKRRAETLTTREQQELIALSDQIEDANVRRIEAVAELARLRQTSVRALMNELGLKPVAHG